MKEEDLDLPPMTLPEAVEQITGKPYEGYYSDLPNGPLAPYVEDIEDTLKLCREVSKRLSGGN